MSKQSTPLAPDHLSLETKKLFTDTVSQFIFDPHQVELLVLACEARDRAAQAESAIQEHGVLVTDRFGQLKSNPAVRVKQDAESNFARLIRELRLDDDLFESTRIPRIGGRR